MKSSITVIICVLFSFSRLSASHFFGGELYYECIGNDTFKIYSTIYQNCGESNDSPFDFDPASKLNIFDCDNNLIYSENMSYVDVALDTIAVPVFDSCQVIPSSICIHYRIRHDFVHLPFKEGGYFLSFQKCCLGDEVINILNPEEIGLNLSIHISENALLTCNNSPKFNDFPPVFFCLNTSFSFVHNATDIDNDTIAYKVTVPLKGPDFFNVNANPPVSPPFLSLDLADGYTENTLLGENSSFQVDANSGVINGIPKNEGLFMIGVSATDYRNGQILSSSERVLVYSVQECEKSIKSNFTLMEDCNVGLIQTQNLSENACKYLWTFKEDENSEENFEAFVESEGNYTLSLIAESLNNCKDTSSILVNVEFPCGFEEVQASFQVLISQEEICRGEIVEIITPLCSNYEYTWTPQPDIGLLNSNIAEFTPTETTNYELEIFNGEECYWYRNFVIEVFENCEKPIVEIPNVFTPNGDGKNDYFGAITSFELDFYELSIYSRWGELIYQSYDLNDRWNGQKNNHNAISDVYAWVVRYRYSFEGIIKQDIVKGNVSLIR